MTEETKKATRAYAAVIANRMLKGELRSMLGLRAYRAKAFSPTVNSPDFCGCPFSETCSVYFPAARPLKSAT